MDVDAVLLSVQERDKWRHRLETLTRSLRAIQEEQSRVQRQLRKIKRDLNRIAAYSEAVVDANLPPIIRSAHANTDPNFTRR